MTDSAETHPQPNWRDPTSYDYTQSLNRESWMWEFLRRNPIYRKIWRRRAVWNALVERYSSTKPRIISQVAIPSKLTGWGLLSFPDPDNSDADVFWQPAMNPAVLAVNTSFVSRCDTNAFDIERLGHPVTVLRFGDGVEHVLLGDASRRIQLEIRGSVLKGPVQLHYRLAGSAGIEPKLITLQRLLTLQRPARTPQSHYPRERRANRWTMTLRAIDGLRIGASHREIASVLWGENVVRKDWRSESDYLRSRVRRTIHVGECLTHGGYLDLLMQSSNST